MEHEVGIATTQYCDMMGTAAIDWEGLGLHDIAHLVGIDEDKYFPVSVSFTGKTPVGTGRMEAGWPLRLSAIWAVETAITGGTGDDILKYAESHGNQLPVKRFWIEEEDAESIDLTELMKRFEVRLTTRMDPSGGPFNLVCDEPD